MTLSSTRSGDNLLLFSVFLNARLKFGDMENREEVNLTAIVAAFDRDGDSAQMSVDGLMPSS